MLIATGPPIGPIIAVNGLSDTFSWHLHSLYDMVPLRRIEIYLFTSQNLIVCNTAYGNFDEIQLRHI